MYNNNYNYDYYIFIKEIIKNTNLLSSSNKNVIKALDDTIKVFNSLSSLNQQEINAYLQILFLSLSSSKMN